MIFGLTKTYVSGIWKNSTHIYFIYNLSTIDKQININTRSSNKQLCSLCSPLFQVPRCTSQHCVHDYILLNFINMPAYLSYAVSQLIHCKYLMFLWSSFVEACLETRYVCNCQVDCNGRSCLPHRWGQLYAHVNSNNNNIKMIVIILIMIVFFVISMHISSLSNTVIHLTRSCCCFIRIAFCLLHLSHSCASSSTSLSRALSLSLSFFFCSSLWHLKPKMSNGPGPAHRQARRPHCPLCLNRAAQRLSRRVSSRFVSLKLFSHSRFDGATFKVKIIKHICQTTTTALSIWSIENTNTKRNANWKSTKYKK